MAYRRADGVRRCAPALVGDSCPGGKPQRIRRNEALRIVRRPQGAVTRLRTRGPRSAACPSTSSRKSSATSAAGSRPSRPRTHPTSSSRPTTGRASSQPTGRSRWCRKAALVKARSRRTHERRSPTGGRRAAVRHARERRERRPVREHQVARVPKKLADSRRQALKFQRKVRRPDRPRRPAGLGWRRVPHVPVLLGAGAATSSERSRNGGSLNPNNLGVVATRRSWKNAPLIDKWNKERLIGSKVDGGAAQERVCT